MSDPYQVLGVSSSASDDEIAQAYRKLAKKYHPDLNPGNKEAEKRMREINAAYEQIRTRKNGGASYERQSGGSAYGNPYGGNQGYGQGQNPFEDGPFAGGSGYDPFDIFNMFGGGHRQQQQQQHRPNSPKMQAVHNFIQHQQYAEALRVLSEITERNAEWYYYSALAGAGAGNRVSAMNHAREAVRREPDNDEYQALLEQFERGGFEYRQTGQSYGFDMSNIGNLMMRLCMMQALCMCCQPYACQPYCGPAG